MRISRKYSEGLFQGLLITRYAVQSRAGEPEKTDPYREICKGLFDLM